MLLVSIGLIATACGDDDDDAATSTESATASSMAEASAESSTAAPTAESETAASSTAETPSTPEASSTAETETSEPSATGTAEGLLWDNGPCDAALDIVPIGNTEVFQSDVLSQEDQKIALEAAIEAFNQRGGVGGHCMELTACDSKGDPGTEIACAQELVDGPVVVTMSDTMSFAPADSSALFEEAGLSRIGMNPSSAEMALETSYPLSAGGLGSTILMAPTCIRAGHTKLAAIHLDTSSVLPLFDALQPALDAYGAELVTKIPVPAGTTDFQQFTLAAENEGATCTMLVLGENEAVQVLGGAQQLDADMEFSASLASFSKESLDSFGDYASHVHFVAELPPITASQDAWPILAEMIADFENSGRPELATEKVKANMMRSWVATLVFVRIMEDFGDPDAITRDSVTAAIQAATDVDTFGLIPPWTPTAEVENSVFPALSQPWYYQATYDPADGEWTLADELLNFANEFSGIIEYDQPA